MREEAPTENRSKTSRFSDQNQAVRANGGKTNMNTSKPRSSSAWGSNIVKGFSTDKKAKQQSAIPTKKPPLTSSDIVNQKNQVSSCNSRMKRSIIGDFTFLANATQVHPHSLDCHRTKSTASRDLLLELDHLTNELRESKERELILQSELLECKEKLKTSELERELDEKRSEIESLACKVNLLEDEKMSLSEQLGSLSLVVERLEDASRREDCHKSKLGKKGDERVSSQKNPEMEVLELRRLNKELQLQKRNLACMLSSAESQLDAVAKVSESELVAKVVAEASILRHTNEDLCKQVEGLQMSRFNEVEELAYLRWVNSCLRRELCNSDNQSRQTSIVDLDDISSPKYQMTVHNESSPCCPSTSGSLDCSVKKIMRSYKTNENLQALECQHLLDDEWEAQLDHSPRRRHSISGLNGCSKDLVLNKRRQSDGFNCSLDMENVPSIKDRQQQIAQKYELGIVQSPRLSVNRLETNKTAALDVEKRALRIPNPPPRPSISNPVVVKKDGLAVVAPPPPPPLPPPPPPPPPPLPKSSVKEPGVMQRAPQVVELYHSLMKRDSRKDSSSGGICDGPDVGNVRSSMIGEIENRSSHLLAIKADIETQGEFVNSLIKEVNGAVYHDIEDVVAFVKWLDDELCFLVDERAVLKHFDWPEKKADTLREAAFGYRDLKKLESEVSHFEDDPRLPCDVALKKMAAISEKMERSVYNLLRTRDMTMRHCKEFQIPTDWMLDTGIISKIKFASVKLAKKYMKRVAMELRSIQASEKDPALDYMLLQGVRFAFRVHQFAGGFDAETMHVFEELRNLSHVRKLN